MVLMSSVQAIALYFWLSMSRHSRNFFFFCLPHFWDETKTQKSQKTKTKPSFDLNFVFSQQFGARKSSNDVGKLVKPASCVTIEGADASF